MSKSALSISCGNNISSALLFDFATEYLSQTIEDMHEYEREIYLSITMEDTYEYEKEVYLSIPFNEIDAIIKNFHDVNFLNVKFDELREKEINNNITESEKSLLYDVLEKRILEFPNPYLPSDHEKGMEIIRKYDLIEKRESKKTNKDRFRRKSWFNWF